MPKIQIDMFEVQLGSSVLLQFETPDGPVRVLADAGISASGYSPDHVHRKLPSLLGDQRRIDLIIGTHYDEDHLKGLVSIIEDESIQIGEIWLPPVANETENYAIDSVVDPGSLLPNQFAGEAGEAVLHRYIQIKGNDVLLLRAVEDRLRGGDRLETPRIDLDTFARRNVDLDRQFSLDFFREQLSALDPDEQHDHVSDLDIDPDPRLEKVLSELSIRHYWPDDTLEGYFRFSAAPFAQASQRASLRNIRIRTAREAINGTSLYEVVKAIDRRRARPSVKTEIIEDGTPRHYRWEPSKKRFVLTQAGHDGLRFSLLGPSKSLVRKHRDRLPVELLARVAMTFTSELKGISPSNELSYIGRFEYAKQGILITGDAGCVDFKLNRTTYYQALLDAMLPLHVIQVAHHGGNNAHFYRVLGAARYPEQTAFSFLLLSHAFHDRKRPSPAFHEFILGTLGLGDDVSLLFTSEPNRQKVEDFIGAVHPIVGGGRADVGDIRLQFDRGGWEVRQHLIEVT